jgi:hypothetical protein
MSTQGDNMKQTTTKSNLTAYNVFTKRWFEEHEGATSIPKGLWATVSVAERKPYQDLADRLNKEEGRQPRKGATAARAANGWNSFQTRLGELNTENQFPKGQRLMCTDPRVKACVVKVGPKNKVDGPASIVKLEAFFATL